MFNNDFIDYLKKDLNLQYIRMWQRFRKMMKTRFTGTGIARLRWWKKAKADTLSMEESTAWKQAI